MKHKIDIMEKKKCKKNKAAEACHRDGGTNQRT